MNARTTSLAIAICLALPSFAPAQGGPSREPGFSVTVRAGAGYLSSTDQLTTNDGNKRIESLEEDADRFDKVIPLVLFDARYRLAGRGAEVYAKTPFGEGGPPGFMAGTVQPLGGPGTIDVGLWVNPFGDVWKDPYLVGVGRDETSVLRYGLKVGYDKVWGTRFGCRYSYGRTEIGDDAIGERLGALAREGNTHDLGVEYTFIGPYGVQILPAIEYSRADLDGQANSHGSYGLKLTVRRFSSGYAANLIFNGAFADYQAEHPVFQKSREDWELGGIGILTFTDLFGVSGLLGDLIAGYSYRNSNIDFLDAHTFIGGGMLGYEF